MKAGLELRRSITNSGQDSPNLETADLPTHYPFFELAVGVSDFSMALSALLLSKRIWQICSDIKLIMKIMIAATNKKTLIFVNRLWAMYV